MNIYKKIIIPIVLIATVGSTTSIHAMNDAKQDFIEQAQLTLANAIQSGSSEDVIHALDNPDIGINTPIITEDNLFSYPGLTLKTTPLELALTVKTPSSEIVARLIENKADIEQVNSIGWTPLAIAAHRRHSEIVCLLIFAGALATGKESMQQVISSAQQAKQEEPVRIATITNILNPLLLIPGVINIINDYAAASHIDIKK